MGIEQNLKKLGNLQVEISILEKRKLECERLIETTDKDLVKKKRDAEKEISKEREGFEVYKHVVEENHVEIENKLTKREKTLRIQEQEGRDLDDEIQKFNKRKDAREVTQKELQLLKSNYLDREHKANLLIAQYERKIGEIPKKK